MTTTPPPKPPPGPTQSGRRAGGGAGRGRGRGSGSRERRPSAPPAAAPSASEGKSAKRDKAGKRRGGGARASAAKPRAPRGRKRSGSAGPAVHRKLLVRNIPHTATEKEVLAVLEDMGVGRELVWRFVRGKAHGKNRAPTPARVYLDLRKSAEKADALVAALHGQAWPPRAAGNERPTTQASVDAQEEQPGLDVALAPYQKIPRDKQRKDAKAGTIDRDPEFVAFLEQLNRPREKMPSADVVVDSAESELAEKPVAALVKYLNERKARDKSKGRSGKGDKNTVGRRQGARKKEKGTASKEKAKKDRQKKKADTNSSTTGGQGAAKPRKARGGKSAHSKKEPSSKGDATMEPGMVRIMAPRDPDSRLSGVNVSATTATARGHTAGEASQSEKAAQARPQKGASACGGGARGRGRKENKTGDSPAGPNVSSGEVAGRPRRESRAGGSKSAKPSGGGGGPKPDKKKRSFAPKADAVGGV